MSDLERAAAVALIYYGKRNETRQALATFIGAGLRAQSYGSGGGTRTHCYVHGDDVASCRRNDRCALHPKACDCKTKVPCEGETVMASDRTGDAALGHDPFAQMLEECDRWELRLSAASGVALNLRRPATGSEVVSLLRVAPPSETKPAAVAFGRAMDATAPPREAPKGLAHDGEAGCGSCWRFKKPDGRNDWQPPTYKDGKPTDLGGTLKLRMPLCWSCYRFILDHDRLPNMKELKHRFDDPRDRWPAEHTVKAKAS